MPRCATYRNVDITPLTLELSKSNSINDLQCPHIDLPDSPASNSTSKSGQRIAFLFDSTLTAFLMMGNLSPGLKKHAVTMFEVGKLCDESMDSFLSELEKVSVLDAEGEGEARRYFEHAVLLRSTILTLRKLPGPGLDLVRLESLHSLDEATCLRLLQKKYKLLVSMAPLSKEVRSICSLSPPHLGPAVPEVNSLWFKMFIYHMTGYGPPSLLLVKGTVLKQLPKMFLGFSRILITAWLHEPAVIPVANILHVNAALQYSPVLIQAYGVHGPAQTHVISFPIKPEFNSTVIKKNHPAVQLLSDLLDFEHNCGYMTFANIGVPDFGCSNHDPIVRLGKNTKNPGSAKKEVSNNNNIDGNKSEPTSISNENFNFINVSPKLKQNDLLQSPVESHFALTPVSNSQTSSPANGFTSQDCTDILQQELDQLEKEALKFDEKSVNNKVMQLKLESTYSFDTLLSPLDENISMFSRDNDDSKSDEKDVIDLSSNEDCKSGENWTLLDCQFGVPLFDIDANTQICDTIVYGGLTEAKNLEQLTETSRKLGTTLLEFISQCQYYPGENMGIIKRGRLTPLPKHNLIFDNGKVSEWSCK